MKARAWCFTLNNPDSLLDFSDNDCVRYAVYQEEIGENGTNHFQGYIELYRQQRLSWMQDLIPGAHFEIRRGTRDEARNYAMKKDTRIGEVFEYGEWISGQGSRQDIIGFKRSIDSGKSDLELWDEHPEEYLKYNNVIPTVRALREEKRNWVTTNILLYGKTNVGKTTWCEENFPGNFRKQPCNKWFDGYAGEEAALFDEMNGSWMPFSVLMQVMDRFPCRVEVKSTKMGVNWKPRVILMTTNHLPHTWYDKDNHVAALLRRFSVFLHFRGIEDIKAYYDYEEFKFAVHDFETKQPLH